MGEQVAAGIPYKNKSKTLPYKVYREFNTLVSTSDRAHKLILDTINTESEQSIPVEMPRIAKRFLEVTCDASYMVP